MSNGHAIWKGNFTSDFLENTCRRTGRELTYKAFVKMLIGAIQRHDQTTAKHMFLDLLGYEDL